MSVVFVDIVGFTALSEQADPEQVKNLVDEVFERLAGDITGFGGRVDKVLGDGILAIFGAPIAHEDDAERAIRASLTMQKTVGTFNEEYELDLAIRIGVNTGEVLVGEIRAAGDYTAMGDAVNIASRLSGLALPGQVAAGHDTYLATELAVSYEAQGQMQLAGRSEPVATWIALAAMGLPGRRGRRRGEMIGRDAELSVALQSIESAFRTKRSLLMLVLGDAGVGKSRLAEEVAAHADRSDAVVLAGRCVPYGEANIWFPIAEAVKMGLDLDGGLDDDPSIASVQLSDAVIGLVGADAVETVRIVNGLLFLFDISGPLDRIEPKRAQDEAARSARMSLEALADRRPVFLRLIDLHWADALVLDIINDIVERMAHKPFVMMATARLGLSQRWAPRPGRHNMVTFTLDPLDGDSAADLARNLLPEATDEFRADLVERSGGNPFFLEELATLIDSDGMAGAAGLPGTIRGLIAARLDRLDSASSGVLEDAAVLGSRGITLALQKMAEARGFDGDVQPLTIQLADAGVLEVDHQARIWEFHSDLVRDVVYERLTKSDRAIRHFGVAHYIESEFVASAPPSVVAHHYRRAAELDREMGGVRDLPSGVADRAIEWIGRAASEAMATERWETAVTLWGQMLGLLAEADERRISALLGRIQAFTGARLITEAQADLAQVEELSCGDAGANAPLLALRRGDIDSRSGRLDSASKAFEEAVAGFRLSGDLHAVAEVQRAAGMNYLMSGASEKAEAALKEALAASIELDDTRNEAWARQNLAWLGFVQGRTTKAEERITKATALFTQLGDEIGLSWSRGLLAYVRMHQGLFGEAEQLAEASLADSVGRKDRWGEGMMLVLLGSIELWRGNTLSAVRLGRQAVALFRDINDPFGLIQGESVLGRALIRSGQVEAGFAVLVDAQGVLPEGDEGIGQLARATLATSQVSVGLPELALEQLGHTVAKEIDPSLIGQSEWVVALGLALLQAGRLDESREVLEYAANTMSDIGRDAAAVAALALVVATDGDVERSDELLLSILAAPRTTYLDRLRTYIAHGLAKAAARDGEGAEGSFADARVLLDPTGDELALAVLALAQSMSAEHLGLPTASTLAAEAGERLSALGIEALGWRQAFGNILARD